MFTRNAKKQKSLLLDADIEQELRILAEFEGVSDSMFVQKLIEQAWLNHRCTAQKEKQREASY